MTFFLILHISVYLHFLKGNSGTNKGQMLSKVWYSRHLPHINKLCVYGLQCVWTSFYNNLCSC